MRKRIYMDAFDSAGAPAHQLIPSVNWRVLDKTAAGLYAPVGEFVASIKPDPSKLYVLSTGLGAYETYQCNRNGDAFRREVLQYPGDDWGISTFKMAGLFAHHQNSDPARSIGKIAFAAFNPGMDRVELLLEIDRQRAVQEKRAALVETLDAGLPTAWSMGCRVVNDQCSICDHCATTRVCKKCSPMDKAASGGRCDHEYCVHAATQLGQMLPDGRVVCVFNPQPKFHDYSEVYTPADSVAMSMKKVASLWQVAQDPAIRDWSLPSALIAEQLGESDPEPTVSLAGKVAEAKDAAIRKRIPLAAMQSLADREEPLPDELITAMAADPDGALSTAASLGIVFSRPEFQRLALVAAGHPEDADTFAERGACFTVAGTTAVPHCSFLFEGCVREDLLDALVPYVEKRSVFEPALTRRLPRMLGPHTPLVDSSEGPLANLGPLYLNYREGLAEKMPALAHYGILQKAAALEALLGESMLEGGHYPLVKIAETRDLDELMWLSTSYPIAYLCGAHLAGAPELKKLAALRAVVAHYPQVPAEVAAELPPLFPYVRRTAEGLWAP